MNALEQIKALPAEAVQQEANGLSFGVVSKSDWLIPTECGVRVVDARMAYGWNECRKEMADRLTALQALRDEAGDAVQQLAECFRLAGGDTECVSAPEGQARQAAEVVRDLRACYDEAIRPAPAAEAAPQGGVKLNDPDLQRQMENGAAHFHRVVAALNATPQGAIRWPERMVNLPCPDGSTDRIIGFRVPEGDPILGDFGLSEPLAWLRSVTIDRLTASPPSAPAVDDVVSALVDLAAKVREERASYTLTHFDNDARTLIRRLSAPVPQEGVDEAMEERALRAFWQAYGDQQRLGGGRQAGRTAAGIRAVLALAAGALPHGMVLVPKEPTTVMVNAGVDADDLRTGFETVRHIYTAMLAAAPAQGVRS